MRDDFTPATKLKLAKRAGCLCSNPHCRRPTIGAAQGHEGVHNIGVAAHITAASRGGPRYDASLTSEQRRDAANGIWLCQTHGDLVDGDDKNFTVDMLLGWKRDAERRSFEALLGPGGASVVALDGEASHAIEEQLGVTPDASIDAVFGRVRESAMADLAAFKRMPGWPQHPVALNLRAGRPFSISTLAAAVEAFNEFTIIAPPGTGKTTTLLQLADAINAAGRAVALFIALGEWSTRSHSLTDSCIAKPGFQNVAGRDLALLAENGRLVLVLDGWNELDTTARKRATVELNQLQRAYPLLGIIISTRREALDVPRGGPAVDIELLDHMQQREIARAYRGSDGEALLDAAWRTPGIRDLVAIPLYLTTLLASTPGKSLPTTKEEILRLFVRQHEAERADVLRAELYGFHPLLLTALATEATHTATTAISDPRARAVVKAVEDKLAAEGQISSAPQPMHVLDVLVSQHALIRFGAGILSFQHQQFQEWYASFEVEHVMRQAASNGEEAVIRLRSFLDNRAWEESILFAIERVSREQGDGARVVAATAMQALSVDPLLAAEIIYRSSEEVWQLISERVIAFVDRWHLPGKIDRAVRFMVASGRPEFAAAIWPLVESPDSQIYLSVIRAAPRFRPSVLGPDVVKRLASIPAATRGHVLAELAMHSRIDGIDLATAIAKADASAEVRFEVVQALQFRRADRHVSELLADAPDAVWQQLARRGYSGEVAEPAAAERLRMERAKLVADAPDPLARLSLVLNDRDASPSDEATVEEIVASPEFPMREESARTMLHRAWKSYPDALGRGVLRRLEAGCELPFRAEEFLARVPPVDHGTIATLALDPNTPTAAGITAARVAGPNVASALMDALVNAANRLHAASEGEKASLSDELNIWTDRLSVTRVASFIAALVTRDASDPPHVIGAVGSLIARHNSGDQDKEPLELENEADRLIGLLRAWAGSLVSSAESRRHQLASLASAIGRLGRAELLDVLASLRDEDALRRRAVQEQSRALGTRASIELRSDAVTVYNLQYRDAFAEIGEPAAVLMIGYLENEAFGFDAACVLKAIYDRKHGVEKPSVFKSWPHLPDAARRCADRRRDATHGDASYSDAIFAAIERLISPGSGVEQQALAIMIARIALSIPYSSKEGIIARLLALPRPIRTKRELVAALVLAGESFEASLALDAITDWIEDARQNTWRFRQGIWEVVGWLELLPFSDRPAAVLDGLQMTLDVLPARERMERVVSAAAAAPGLSEEQLSEMLRRFPDLASPHEWAEAFLGRGTVAAATALIGLLVEGRLGSGATDVWWLAREIASLAHSHPELKTEILRLYESASPGAPRELLERVLANLGDTASVLALVRGYARLGKGFDGLLHEALRHAAVNELEQPGTAIRILQPVSIATLRKALFAMLDDDEANVAALAKECLVNVDRLRDDFGPAESEPRHPEIGSGRPWPTVADY